jgi:uncharacterized delta-60 repeat protein
MRMKLVACGTKRRCSPMPLVLGAAALLVSLSAVDVRAEVGLDPTFGTGSGTVMTDINSNHYQNFANAVALQPDGKIVAVGHSSADFAVVRYKPDGSLDASFGSGGQVTTPVNGFSEAHAVAIQSDGKIVVAGDTNGFGVARYIGAGPPRTTSRNAA